MKFITTVLFAILFMNLSGQKPNGYDAELKTLYNNTVDLIYSDELAKKMGENQKVYILDTREAAEYKVSHLKEARNVGFNNFSSKSVSDIPKDAEIIVYCSLGVRSEKIGEQLKEAGYSEVKNLYGGIFEWVYYDNLIVNKKGLETEKVHTYDENWSKWLLKGEKIY